MQTFHLFTTRCAALFAAIVISFIAPSCIFSQGNKADVTNAGTRFLVCFMQNEEPAYDPAEIQQIYIVSGSDSATTVTITCKQYPLLYEVIPIAAHGTYIFEANHNSFIAWPNSGIINTDEVIDSTVFNIYSTFPIICYGMSVKQFTCDAFLCLPQNSVSTEYLVMSYYNSNNPLLLGSGQEKPSEFCVASFDDSNTVTIIPTAQTANGVPIGAPMTFILNAGKCVQIQAERKISMADLTGSIVRSTKPVVVYGGHSRTEVPTGQGYIDDNSRVSRDHISEVMPPLSTWGTHFLTKNFGRQLGDLLRVLAQSDNTVIKINGQAWGAPLKAREFRDTMIAQSNIPANNIFAVESSSPILAGMLAHTASSSTDQLGDAFLEVIPPIEQTYHDFTYFIANDNKDFDPNQQYVIIYTEVSGVGKITIDGNTIPAAAYTNAKVLLNGKQYAATTVKQTGGIHHAVSPNPDENGFIIVAYGWGTVVSYGYCAGAAFQPMTGLLPIANPNCTGNITIRNILASPVILDSTQIFYTVKNTEATVHLKLTDNYSIAMGSQQTFDLVATSGFSGIMKGSVRVFYHTANWNSLAPVDFPFCITTGDDAPAPVTYPVTLENYPNPGFGKLTVSFSTPVRTTAIVKIYDALGRTVRTVSEGIAAEGAHSFEVSGLPAGSYILELSAPEIGVSEHRQIIVL